MGESINVLLLEDTIEDAELLVREMKIRWLPATRGLSASSSKAAAYRLRRAEFKPRLALWKRQTFSVGIFRPRPRSGLPLFFLP